MTVEPLPVDYFDGRSARAQRALLHIEGSHVQVLRPARDPVPQSVLLVLPLAALQWPERTRHGARIAHIVGGGELHAVDVTAWDGWTAAHELRQPLVVRGQRSWRVVLAALAIVALLAYGGWRWGVPLVARAAVAALPESADRSVGDAAYDSLRSRWLSESVVPAPQRERLVQRFDAAWRLTHGAGEPPPRIAFHASRIGPNAFALPGGRVVVTDELVSLLADDETVLIGVLAHEAGHVRQRHGMRLLVQTTLLGVAASALAGDYAGWLATAPALLAGASYSRAFEHEADDESIRVLRAAGHDPAVMTVLFERLAERRGRGGVEATDSFGIAFASHPSDAERVARFRAASKESSGPQGNGAFKR